MDPFSLIMMAASFGGKFLGAGGKLFEGEQKSEQDKLQAKVAGMNATLAEKQAEIEGQGVDVAYARSALEQSRVLARSEVVLSGQTAHFAAAGFDPAYGSPLALQAFSASQAAADQAIIGAGAELEAAHALTRKASQLGQAAGARYQQLSFEKKAFADKVAGWFGAGTALLSGGPASFGLGGGGGGGAGSATAGT